MKEKEREINQIGTVQNEDEDDRKDINKYRQVAKTAITRRDVLLVLGGILALNLFGVLELPFVNQFTEIPYYDAIITILVAVTVAIGTVWRRVERIVEDIYSKNWSYIAYIDASSEFFGVWKTDPDTLKRTNQKVDIENGETIATYREGVDVAGRRYALVQDLRPVNDDTEVKYRIKNIMGWDELPDDDQLISDKTQFKHWRSQVLPEAEQGRKERLSRSALRQKIISDVVTKIAVKYENATNRGVIDMESLYNEVFEDYNKVNNYTDDFLEDTNVDTNTDTGQTETNKSDSSEVEKVDVEGSDFDFYKVNKGDQE